MKYIVEMEYKHRSVDGLVLETDNLDEAFDALHDRWHHLTASERKDLDYLHLIESENPDEDAPNHYDGDIIIDCTLNYRPVERYADNWYGGEVDIDYVEECQARGIPMDDLLHLIKSWHEDGEPFEDIMNQLEVI